MTNSSVSVALATYNGEKYLREQLDSLLTQTVALDEIVVCDDGSNDKTVEILKEYSLKCNLKYVVNEKNLGVNKNFEKAIRLCTNQYVAICDQDDIWFPRKIEVLLKKIREVESDRPCVVSSQSQSLSKNKGMEPYRTIKDSVGVYATLLATGNVQGCTLMLNRKMIDLLKPFPKSYKEVMMYDGYISFVAATCGVKYNIGEVLMFYRHHETNVLGRIQEKQTIVKRMIAKIRYLKYERLFPSSRCFTLRYVCDEYSDVMHEESKNLVRKMIDYGHGGLLDRLGFILSINYFGRIYIFKHLLLELFMSCIPVKKCM